MLQKIGQEDLESQKVLAKLISDVWLLTSTGQIGHSSNGQTRGISGGRSPDPSKNIDDRSIPDDQILQNYIEKYHRILDPYSSKLSAVIGEPDFQPSSFLKVGVNRSNAVCRIVISPSIGSLEKAIDLLRDKFDEILEKYGFESPEDLKLRLPKQYKLSFPRELGLIFSIPADSMKKFFGDSSYDDLSLLDSLRRLEDNLNELLKLSPFPLGTGFLVGDRYLLTNCHVLPTREISERCTAQFGYEDGFDDNSALNYDFDPKSLFIASQGLDYTLIQLKPNASNKRHAGYKFGWLDLIESEDSILPSLEGKQVNNLIAKLKEKYNYSADDLKLLGLQKDNALSGSRVAIIQHPRGRKKEIVLRNNRVTELTSNNATYEADTDYGSSGSPVFNSKWELVAITKKVVPRETSEEQPKTTPDELSKAEQSGVNELSQIMDWIASRGTRTCRIVEDLKRRSFRDSKLQNFIENYVITSEQLKHPPLPAALELNGLNDYIQIDSTSTSDSTNTSDPQAFSVELWVNLTGEQKKSTIFTAFCREAWAGDESTLGDVLLHCYLTPEGQLVLDRKQIFNSYRSDSLLYPANRLTLFYPKRYPPFPFIREGYEGTKVKAFKQFFNLVSGLELCLEEPYIFSEQDAEGVKEFQRSHKDRDDDPLAVDGVVGPITLGALWQSIKFEKGNEYPAIPDLRYLLTLIGNELFPNEDDRKRILEGNNFFCDAMEEAIKSFQKMRRMNVSGDINYRTLNSLWNYGLTLRKGNQAQSVKDLQLLLKRYEDQVFGPGTFDHFDPGTFDQNTKEAVERFQDRNGLTSDGIFGSQTLKALLNLQSYESRAQNFSSVGLYSHMAVTYDGETLRLLINGKGEGESSRRKDSTRKEKLKFGHADATSSFVIGAYTEVAERVSEESSWHFQGSLAGLRIWKRDRTQEIKNDPQKRLKGNEADLIGYWRLEEAEIFSGSERSETDNKDTKLLLNRATNQGVSAFFRGNPSPLLATRFPTLLLAFSREFKDESHTLECPKFQFSRAEEAPFTVEAWVKHIFGNGSIVQVSASSQNGFCFRLGFQDERLFVEFQGEGDEEPTQIEMEARFPHDLFWHHVVVVLNDRSEIWMYLDGRAQPTVVVQADKTGSIMIQGRRRAIGYFQSPIDVKDCSLFIGKREEEKHYFHIAIAEVRIWETARTQEQIKMNQFYRLRGDEGGLIGYWRLDDGEREDLAQDSSPYKRDIRRRSSDSLN